MRVWVSGQTHMKKCVADEFLTSGASGRRSSFHSDGSQEQLLFASASPHWQHGGGGDVPLFVHVHELRRLEFVEHTPFARAHGSFKS